MRFFLPSDMDRLVDNAIKRAVNTFNNVAEKLGIPVRLEYENGELHWRYIQRKWHHPHNHWHHHCHWHHPHMHHEKNTREVIHQPFSTREKTRQRIETRSQYERSILEKNTHQIARHEEENKHETAEFASALKQVLSRIREIMDQYEQGKVPREHLTHELIRLSLLLESASPRERVLLFHGLGIGRFIHGLLMYASGEISKKDIEALMNELEHRLQNLEKNRNLKTEDKTSLMYWIEQLYKYYKEAIKELENGATIGTILDKFIKEYEKLIEEAPPQFEPILKIYFKHMIKKLYRWYLYLSGALTR